MKSHEWDKCFVWLAAMFPQWATSAATSAVWFDELGKLVDPEEFKNAVRVTMSHKPGPFPPGMFEIKSVFQAKEKMPPGDMLWETIFKSGASLASLPLQAQKALESMGGYDRLAMVDLNELKFLKKTFIDSYDHYCATDISQIELRKTLGGGKAEVKQLGSIQNLIGSALKKFA